VRDLLADDVEMDFQGQPFKGKDEVVRFMAFDDGMGSRVEVANVSARGDTVTFDLLESNEFMRTLGVPQIRGHQQFVLANGKVRRTADLRPPDGSAQLDSAWVRFAAWAQANRPQAMAALSDSESHAVVSREAGRALVALAKEWRAATDAK
jgi:hypothetical protein